MTYKSKPLVELAWFVVLWAVCAMVGIAVAYLMNIDWYDAEPTMPINYNHLHDATITIQPSQGNVLGETHPDGSITIYVNENTTTNEFNRVLAHETGHYLDITRLTRDDRERWAEQRGIPADWWPKDNGRESGAEDFAEAYASWVTGDEALTPYGDVSDEDISLLESLIEN